MAEHPILFCGDMIRALLDNRKTQTRRIVSRNNSLVDGTPCPKAFWGLLDFASPKIHVDPGPSPAGNPGPYFHVPCPSRESVHRVYPKWQVGDTLWVKETFWFRESDGLVAFDDGSITTNASSIIGAKHYIPNPPLPPDWPAKAKDGYGFVRKPSIFMWRWASRISLRITAVRGQMVQEISDEDAIAEGAAFVDFGNGQYGQQLDGWRCDRAPASHDDALPTARLAYGNLWDKINGPGSWNANPLVWVYSFERTDPPVCGTKD